MSKYKLGILGGMGPLATSKVAETIINLTNAHNDQEHIPMLICSNARIPDRTEAISTGSISILDALEKELETLHQAGVERIIVPCNTAHYYLDFLQERSSIPIINMVQTTLDYIKRVHPSRPVTVLGTVGTYLGNVYESFRPTEVDLRRPGKQGQEALMEIIMDIKQNGEVEKNARLLGRLIRKSLPADEGIFILACTELSMTKGYLISQGVAVVDAAEVLAISAIRQLGFGVRTDRTNILVDYLA